MNGWCFNLAATALVALLVSPPANVAESLAAARDLYAAADYEGSLALLNQLQDEPVAGDDARGIGLYQAYCLLALGRQAEAEQAIAAVVSADPAYRPSGSEVSPRVLNAFEDVRRRLLPDLIQARYGQAKAAFEAKAFERAVLQFDAVLAMLDDPALGERVSQPPLADLRMLAGGFRDLSAQSIPPPPPPAPVVAAPPAPPPVAVVAPPRIYASDDPGVSPPVAVRQTLPTLPPLSAQRSGATAGVLDVLIDDTGAVEAVAMRVPIDARIDAIILDAARKWRYQPAMHDGKPVRYRKLMQVAVK
jgi:hypothetical protein